MYTYNENFNKINVWHWECKVNLNNHLKFHQYHFNVLKYIANIDLYILSENAIYYLDITNIRVCYMFMGVCYRRARQTIMTADVT